MQSGKIRGIAVGIVISFILAFAAVIADGGRTTTTGAFTALSFFVVLAAASYLYKRWPQYRRLTEPSSDIRNADVGDIVEIDGTLEAGEETIPAPFTGNDTLATLWTIEELSGSVRHAEWYTIAGGGGTADPVLVTDSGERARLNIEPVVEQYEIPSTFTERAKRLGGGEGILLGNGQKFDDVTFDILEQETTHEIEPSEDVPNHIEQFLESQGIEESEKRSSAGVKERGTRKFKEGRLTAGDEVFVRAKVTDTGFNETTLGVTDDGLTIIADMTKEEYIEATQEIVYLLITLVAIHGVALLSAIVSGIF